jgi:predicted nucleic acid-binding Zn finger protein
MTSTLVVGKPERRGVGWWVPSSSGAWGYYVELGKDTVRCTCPSFVHRRTSLLGGECKHLQAVRKAVAMG